MFDISDLDKVMFGSKPAGEGEGGGIGGGGGEREEGGGERGQSMQRSGPHGTNYNIHILSNSRGKT